MTNWEKFLIALICQNTKILTLVSLQEKLELIEKWVVFLGTQTCI